MAQNFVGSNNINLLMPLGQFGTRNKGGKDSASPRYIFTNLNKVTRHLFNSNDLPLMDYIVEEGQKIEPKYYLPIIPNILVNGTMCNFTFPEYSFSIFDSFFTLFLASSDVCGGESK